MRRILSGQKIYYKVFTREHDATGSCRFAWNFIALFEGRKLKHMIESAGYTPRMIQNCLHLSCVQPIYRWYKGVILPSVDHLFMLSELLNVHMEDFLVKKNEIPVIYDMEQLCLQDTRKRFIAYYKKIC